MKQIRDNCVYKIGEELYSNGDKNSGLHEYNLIAHNINKSNIEDTLVIINGKFTKADEQLSKLLYQYDKKIFICSDAIAFENNKDIINECDILLHQCPFNKIPNVSNKIIQHYSYVPELFYIPFSKVEQDNLLFYGGGLRNDLTLDYLNAVPSKSLLKNKQVDDRLDYLDYLCEAKKHKFALIIGREQYNELGWITSRFVEAASCWNYPIVDIEYDKHQYFGMTKMINTTDVRNTIESLSKDNLSRETRIKFYRHRFSQDYNKFIKLVEELTK